MKLILLFYGLLVICVSFICAKPLQEGQLVKKNVWVPHRQDRHRIKRQFSLNLGATHEDGYGTDVNAEAIASLWKSTSGNTKLDGSATYTQHFGGLAGDGHDYRLKLKVVFTR